MTDYRVNIYAPNLNNLFEFFDNRVDRQVVSDAEGGDS